MKRPFAKPATTYEEQVALLQHRGMIIDDVIQARFYLKHADLLAVEKRRGVVEAETVRATLATWNRFAEEHGSFADEHSKL